LGTIAQEERLSLPQQEFLREAMLELGLTRESFAKRIGAPWETFKKWLLPAESGGNREMPAIAWSLVREVIEHERLKRECKTLMVEVKKNV
jgi:transcriptional regulator with XRE-family HTH domain